MGNARDLGRQQADNQGLLLGSRGKMAAGALGRRLCGVLRGSGGGKVASLARRLGCDGLLDFLDREIDGDLARAEAAEIARWVVVGLEGLGTHEVERRRAPAIVFGCRLRGRLDFLGLGGHAIGHVGDDPGYGGTSGAPDGKLKHNRPGNGLHHVVDGRGERDLGHPQGSAAQKSREHRRMSLQFRHRAHLPLRQKHEAHAEALAGHLSCSLTMTVTTCFVGCVCAVVIECPSTEPGQE